MATINCEDPCAHARPAPHRPERHRGSTPAESERNVPAAFDECQVPPGSEIFGRLTILHLSSKFIDLSRFRRISNNNRVGGYIARNHRPGADDCAFTNCQPRQNYGSPAYHCAVANPGADWLEVRIPAFRPQVVGQGDVRTDEHIIPDRYSVPN